MDLGPVDGNYADLGQPAARTQRQDLAEQGGDRVLVALEEAGDRRVIRTLLGRDDAERDVLLTRAR